MKLGLVLSNDWELFGNGAGDFGELQEKPLREMLEVTAGFGARPTLFAEVGQQLWGACRLASSDPRQRELATRWEEALKAAVAAGADVQAHFHSQWLDAKHEQGRWTLSAQRVFGDLTPGTIRDVLKSSKKYLDELLQPVNPNYACVCFRAGAFYIEPSQDPLSAMREIGYRADSSVVFGLHEGNLIDFRDLPSSLPPWPIAAGVTHAAVRSDLQELPVYARRAWDSALLRKFFSPRLYYALFWRTWVEAIDDEWLRRRNKVMMQRYPLADRVFLRGRNPFREIISRLLNRTALILDYDQMPPALFVRFLELAWKEHASRHPGRILPIVALGHSKGMPDGHNLRRILELATRQMGERLCFMTMREAIECVSPQKANDFPTN
jgi:hypothetical protein